MPLQLSLQVSHGATIHPAQHETVHWTLNGPHIVTVTYADWVSI